MIDRGKRTAHSHEAKYICIGLTVITMGPVFNTLVSSWNASPACFEDSIGFIWVGTVRYFPQWLDAASAREHKPDRDKSDINGEGLNHGPEICLSEADISADSGEQIATSNEIRIPRILLRSDIRNE